MASQELGQGIGFGLPSATTMKRASPSAGDWLLGADPERLIGLGRLLTGILAIIAVYLDPTRPTPLLFESRAVLCGYVLLSIALVAYPLSKSLSSPVHLIVHVIDAAVLGWLTILTNELASPYFTILPFVLLAMAMRWGLKGAALGALILLLVLSVVGLPDLLDGESELNVFIMRSTYFVFAAVILGYFGAYRERSRQRLAQLAKWPIEATSDKRAWLASLFKHASEVLDGCPLLLVWRSQEHTEGFVAYWEEGRLKLVDVDDQGFWDRHDFQLVYPLMEQRPSSSCRKELAALRQELPQIAGPADGEIRNVSCAPFSSTRYRGRVFVINSNCGPDEMDALAEIIATRFGSELERFALMQQIAEAARSEERMRLSRDLHDSVLQDLTATRIKLKLAAETAGGSFKSQLDEVGSLLFDQQQRIRQFVEDNRKVQKRDRVKLDRTLSDFLGPLGMQWNCQIDVSLEPPELKVPKWMVHEIKQLVSEAAANAVCHGRADRLRVSIAEADNGLRLDLVDNGSGMPGKTLEQPLSISARVARLGGNLALFDTKPGFGIHIALPASHGAG